MVDEMVVVYTMTNWSVSFLSSIVLYMGCIERSHAVDVIKYNTLQIHIFNKNF